jgi:hypothetical protein
MADLAPGARLRRRGVYEPAARDAREQGDYGDYGEPDEIEFEGGAPDWERRLTRREKLVRGGSAALVVAVVAYLLLGGPAATLALLRALAPRPPEAVAAPAPPTVAAHRSANAGVPPSAANNPTLKLAPANGPSGAAYACWLDPRRAGSGASTRPLRVASLADGQSDWQALAPPVAGAASCALAVDPTRADTLLLAAGRVSVTASATICPLPDLYLSTVRGASWQRVPLPRGAAISCFSPPPSLAIADDRIFMRSASALLPARAVPAGALGQLIVTADRGRTWRAADAGLAPATSLTLLAMRPGGHLLAQTAPAGHADTGMLWQSADAGAHWRSLGPLPGTAPHVYVSSDPGASDHGGWGRLYVSARERPDTRGDGPERSFLASAYAGEPWARIPGPPGPPGTSAISDALAGGGESQIAEGPAGALLFTRSSSDPGRQRLTPPFALWIWDAGQQRWLQYGSPLPANALVQGAAWDGGRITVWLMVVRGVTPPLIDLVTLELAAADLTSAR